MDLYFDPKGNPAEPMEWAENFSTWKQDSPHWITCLQGGTPWGQYRVSTVWMGMNYQFDPNGPPLVWETMVFEGESWEDLLCRRYTTEAQAHEGHFKVAEYVKAKLEGHSWNRRQMVGR